MVITIIQGISCRVGQRIADPLAEMHVIRQGTRRDAVLFSVGANASHGLRRTNDDKRRAVMTLLSDSEWRKWPLRKIARRCGVHHEMVGTARRSLADSASDDGVR